MTIKDLPAKPRKGRKFRTKVQIINDAVKATGKKTNIPGAASGFVQFPKPTNKIELMAMLKRAVENTK